MVKRTIKGAVNKRQKINQIRKAKSNPDHRKKLKKTLDIPNLEPMKQSIARKLEMQQEREKNRIMRYKTKEERQIARERMDIQKNEQTTKLKAHVSLDLQNASARAALFAQQANESEQKDTLIGIPKDGSKQQFYRKFKHVVQSADIILEVLDARDPNGCRCKPAETMIAGGQKKLILVMNKIDLVPKHIAEGWLKVLKNEFPTILFKASTQKDKRTRTHHPKKANDLTDDLMDTSMCLGADALMQLLKNYSRSGDKNTSATIGVIGYPNVGKSSLINSLKGVRAVGVSSTPGFTQSVSEIRLDKHLSLLDCPGIVFDTDDTAIALRNSVKVEQLADPVGAAEEIIKRTPNIMKHFNVPSGKDYSPNDLLLSLAMARGKLKKGGIADIESIARMIIKEWNSGLIPYWVEPPKVSGGFDTMIVSEFAPELDLDEINAETIHQLETKNDEIAIEEQTNKDIEEEMEDESEEEMEDESEEMEEENEEESEEENEDHDEEDNHVSPIAQRKNSEYLLNPQENKFLKQQWKKAQKKKKKMNRF